MKHLTFALVAATTLLGACSRQEQEGQPETNAGVAGPADAIWFGGPIVTVDDDRPEAEAVAVAGGRILAVGPLDEIMATQGDATRMIDLEGKTLIPGFVDAHGHVFQVGLQAVSANLLPPPDGPGSSIARLQEILREFRRQSPIPDQFGLLIGYAYDDSQLAEGRHPTASELDAVASDIPVVVIHQSGHMGVLNSMALSMAGITADTPDPNGGKILRMPSSNEPSGVLQENAFLVSALKVLPRLTDPQLEDLLVEGMKLYTSFGYTTIQDGRSAAFQARIAQQAASNGRLTADVVFYADALVPGTYDLMKPPVFHDVRQPPTYTNRFRVGGLKLTLDGSPQGKTAWLSSPYFKPPSDQPADYAGFGVVDDDTVLGVLNTALQNHWQILVHANGDRAIDQLLATFRKARQASPGVDVRPVLIHGQTLRADQVPVLKELGIFPSLFPMHTYYWGDWHRESVLGPERAENISPTQWVLREGLTFTSHHDAPVTKPNAMRVFDATVNRTTRTGHVLGPDQRVDPMTGLKAMTLWAAYQHWEEASKGSITPGKLADFAVLSDNPLTVDRARIADIRVLETIKEGESIYTGAADAVALNAPDFGVHGDPSLPAPGYVPAAVSGDGELSPALEVIYQALYGGEQRR